MDQHIGYCIPCSKQFKGKVGLSIHQRRMHAAEYHQRITDQITSIQSTYVRPRWTDHDSRKMALVEIDIMSGKSDNKRFPINRQIMQRFEGKTLTSIKTHRASHKYKELVRTLQLNVDVSNDTTTLYIDTNDQSDLTILNDTTINTDTNITTDTDIHTEINISTNINTLTDLDNNVISTSTANNLIYTESFMLNTTLSDLDNTQRQSILHNSHIRESTNSLPGTLTRHVVIPNSTFSLPRNPLHNCLMNRNRENILNNIFETNSIATIPVLHLLITALHNIYNNTDIINIQELIDFDLQHLMLKSKSIFQIKQ